jgi:leucyl/phenylalanyl-tRNA--protein transferase
MPVLLDQHIKFPSVDEADENGVIAIGGDLSSNRLLAAYRLGIFPWPHNGLPLLWFCPDPRFVLEPRKFVINQSLKKILKQTSWTIKADTNFLSVINKCAAKKRHEQDGTWITPEVIEGYHALYRLGFAHSIEAYDQDELIGGLYGVSIGSIFFGESMFFEKTNASKICFLTLIAHLIEWEFSLVDCQIYTSHLEKFGAQPMNRDHFLKIIGVNTQSPTKMGPWQLHLSFVQMIKSFSQT